MYKPTCSLLKSAGRRQWQPDSFRFAGKTLASCAAAIGARTKRLYTEQQATDANQCLPSHCCCQHQHPDVSTVSNSRLLGTEQRRDSIIRSNDLQTRVCDYVFCWVGNLSTATKSWTRLGASDRPTDVRLWRLPECFVLIARQQTSFRTWPRYSCALILNFSSNVSNKVAENYSLPEQKGVSAGEGW